MFRLGKILQSGLLFSVALSFLACAGFHAYRVPGYQVTQPIYYRVQTGDTLYSVARRYGVGVERLALLNGIHDPNKLEAGAQLFVSYGSSEQAVSRAALRSSDSSSVRPAAYFGKGGQLRGSRISWPIAQGRISSRFGPRRGSFHDGIDFAAPIGTSIVAAHDGVVAYSGQRLSGYGKMIVLQNKSGLVTIYAHNRRNFVSKGDFVQRGQRIATVGMTGRTSGPHLHFEMRLKDRYGRFVAVDPIPFLKNNNTRSIKYRINENLAPILAKFRGS